jgi:hypothetical protein
MKINSETLQAFGLFAAGLAIILVATKKFISLEQALTIFAIIIGVKLMTHGLAKLKRSK